ncbi:TlpA family protein disulfide reductase [Algibacter amylolyticus]|uniref:TlpA family protein disulfide reductase n=1 Tax=Algibacter amylolyticus TaxID=1608400 RepID=A0A5M7BA33_9FLAO|nr:TlpA disulfide reductase family protein [Algibacter amylolyticus]KAA5824404.1 TlpA family protein disulfide reductase [Algibacter amylolyticus]MBB5269538.1 thiol-disulfide isomerase/thioredoxin [Algibacter amylolyticus]TSJ75177.1 TlpA family protein disulfide reductase [Algibacter amylolyticus]
MTLNKSRIKNIVFFVLIGALLLAQTRKPIQILVNKGFALFAPSTIDASNLSTITDYKWLLKGENNTNFNFTTTKNKVVLLNFWATWCPPCIAEMPSMQLLYEDYKDKIEFVFVTNEDFQTTHSFLIKNKFSFSSYKAISKFPEVFNVSSIPRTFLIDKKGNIVIDKTGASNWNSETVRETIDTLLKK